MGPKAALPAARGYQETLVFLKNKLAEGLNLF
jgi:hypothetical protein